MMSDLSDDEITMLEAGTEEVSLNRDFCNLIGEETTAMRLSKATRSTYGAALVRMTKWLKLNHPHCLVGDVLQLPIDAEVVKAFFFHAMLKANPDDGKYFNPPQFYSFNHVNTYRNALRNYYYENKMVMDPDVDRVVKESMNSYKRRIAVLKESGEMALHEGKQPMSELGYRYLAEAALSSTSDYALTMNCHCFLLLCWNLIARAVSVGNILYESISWEGDALTIFIGKMKNDQEGQNGYARHIYANPENPEICPILSLAVLVFTKGYERPDSTRYLFGSNGKNRFTKWLARILTDKRDAILALGLIIEELGSHSFRKGIATVLANNPGGPEAMNIWLRAGWSLGPVQSRYIFQGAGGDQFVGRAATCLSTNDPSFAVLPPHFDTCDGPVLSTEQWSEVLPDYDTFYPKSFRVALPYLLASLVYHKDWLDETLPDLHPLKHTRVWTSNILNELKAKVQGGIFRNSVTGLNASGIPPYVALYSRFNELRTDVTSQMQDILSKFSAIPDQVTEKVLEHCQVNGAVPISASHLQELIKDLGSDLLLELKSSTATPGDNNSEDNTGNGDMALNGSRTWVWGGKIHMVPKDFRLPRCNTAILWNLYWNGRPADRIQPYRFLNSWDLKVESDRVAWCKARAVINAVVSSIDDSPAAANIHSLAQLTNAQRDNIFSLAFETLLSQTFHLPNMSIFDDRRFGEKSYTTVYDYITRKDN